MEREPKATANMQTEIPRRFILVILCFWGVLTYFALRLNLSVAIVAMVTTPRQNVSTSGDCSNSRNVSSKEEKVGEFTWNAEDQGLVLGGYYYGYLVSQFPGGILAQRIGGKRAFGLGLSTMSIVTLLTPVIARLHVYGLVVLRAFLGLAAGVAYPGIHVVLAKWSPCSEKSRLSAIVFAGTQLGSVVSQAVAGLLSESHFMGGWPSVFYVMGVFGCALTVIWMIVISESPGEHPNISHQEREYIERTAKPTSKKLKTPWASLLSSIPFWAIFVTRICNLWGMFTLFSYLPRYIEQVLNFDTKENGLLSALPYLACWMFIMVAGFLSDFLRKRHMSTKNVRKLMTAAGMIIPASLLVAVSYTGCDVTVNVLFLTLALGFSGLSFSGYYVNHLDIAPRFSGVLYGLSNGAASVTGFVAPYIVGYILEEKQTQEQWRTVFFICAGMYVFGAIIFVIFADGQVQPWAVAAVELEIKQAVSVMGQVTYGLPGRSGVPEKTVGQKKKYARKPGNLHKTEDQQKSEILHRPENLPKPENLQKTDNPQKSETLQKRDNLKIPENVQKAENMQKPDNLKRSESLQNTENMQKPDKNLQKPGENLQKPDVNLQKPDDNLQKPDDNLQKPDENLQKPGENLQKPDVNPQKPDDNLQKPDDNLQKSDENLQKPDANLKRPDENLQKPDANLQKPDENLQKPDANLQKPDANLQKPDENLQKPDENLQKPDENLQKPGENLQNAHKTERTDHDENDSSYTTTTHL